MSNTIESYMVDRRKNNFDFIRLVAAILVIFSHAFPLTLLDGEKKEPLIVLTSGQITLGNLSVFIFFIVSGFLITQSYVYTQNPKKFLIARILRIFPALIVVVLLTVFVLGPIVSTVSAKEYFSNPETYAYLKALLLHPSTSMGVIPSVFENNVYKAAVNSSLWTLEYEFICYLVVALMGILKLLNRPVAIILLIGSVILANIPYAFPVGDYTIKHAAYFMQYFASGMLCFLYRDRIKVNGLYAAISLIILSILTVTGGLKHGIIIFGAYLIIYLVFNPKIKLNHTSKFGDFSYGLYIFAFPIQQILVQYMHPNINPYTNFFLALPLTLICSYFSWHVIEKRALKFKSKKNKSKTPELKEYLPKVSV